MSRIILLLIAALLSVSIPKCANSQIAQPDIQGAWDSPCFSIAIFGGSVRDSHTVQGTSWVQTSTHYRDGNCAAPILSEQWQGGYAIGRELRPGVFEVDVRFDRLIVTAFNQPGVNALLLNSVCSIASWPIGQPVDVTPYTGQIGCYGKIPATFYTIFARIGDQLHLGESDASRDPAARPTQLNQDYFFTLRSIPPPVAPPQVSPTSLD